MATHTTATASGSDGAQADQLRQARDPATPPEALARLAQAEDEVVRAAVALHRSTPAPVLARLLADPSPWVADCARQRNERDGGAPAIHPTAIVHPRARLGADVVIGPFTVVHDRVQLAEGVIVGSHCELGHPAHDPEQGGTLRIGRQSLIRSHSVFYEGSSFGDHLVTGHRVSVRERTQAGPGLQIGTLSDIQGHCQFGDYVRLHSNVHIGQGSVIGNYVWIFPYVVLTNDPHPPSEVRMGVVVEDYVAIATMSVVLPGITIGQGALVGAHSSVARQVPADTVVVGVPTRIVGSTHDIKLRDGSGASAYPWRRHFHRGYLPETVARWIAEFTPNQN
ncbi:MULTISPECIES: N-acetyltransferase [Ottowia]|jgi:acetyltransferase-like isoleucine patch superfamily enzyme|uniref:N-acetyltransferase n=1 Tax=Ottowia TaxID=219181 RepID=UPI002CCAF5E0|nr:N-acetyltransferase [Ottowia sp.]HRN75303.1 N-acetyltransferase [Ottowia sp.]HRQ02501.1 N-acetyltransferase [Ottowia sp.]